nr:hypothetical protein [Micromonospora sp. DSM 115978]
MPFSFPVSTPFLPRHDPRIRRGVLLAATATVLLTAGVLTGCGKDGPAPAGIVVVDDDGRSQPLYATAPARELDKP